MIMGSLYFVHKMIWYRLFYYKIVFPVYENISLNFIEILVVKLPMEDNFVAMDSAKFLIS